MNPEPPELEGEPRAADAAIGELREAYLGAILAGELKIAERVIREAIDSGLREEVIAAQIITPAMTTVGDWWASGRIGVADEHLATDISLRMIALQRESFRVARRRSAATVLLAAAEDERHVVGLEMAASALLHAGFDVRMLGADVPIASITEAVRRLRPRVLGLTAATQRTALHAREAFERAHDTYPELGVVIGGAAAEHATHPGPLTAVCRNVGDAVEIVEGLSQRASMN
jgi:methanogenic corrinoid protein MtbC1